MPTSPLPPPTMNPRVLRNTLRFLHLVTASVIALYLYVPFAHNPAVRLFLEVGIIPVQVTTGLGMWRITARNRKRKKQARPEQRTVVAAVEQEAPHA